MKSSRMHRSIDRSLDGLLCHTADPMTTVITVTTTTVHALVLGGQVLHLQTMSAMIQQQPAPDAYIHT